MRCLVFVVLALFSSSLLAQEERGPYVGVRVAALDYSDNVRSLIEFDDTATGLALTGGYWLNDVVAIEGVISPSSDIDTFMSGNVGVFRADNGAFVGGAYQARLLGEVDYKQIRLVASARHFVIALGFFSMDVTGALTGTSEFEADSVSQEPGTVFSNSIAHSDNGYSLSLGVQWNIKARWSVRAEYEHFDLSRPDGSLVATSMQYRF